MNFLLPLGLGGPDMGFPRLNNISYLLLLPSIVLFLFAGAIENGVGTGWTLTMEYSNGEAVGGFKLFSMREYPLVFYGLRYSWLFKSYVKMLMTRGRYAWIAKKYLVIHQRLNKEYLVKNEKNWFEQWLVGITDGDGTFSFYKQDDIWVLEYKIAQPSYNIKSLFYIKTNLGVGTVTIDNSKAQIVIRGSKSFNEILFPIFDKYPLLTSKYFNYRKLKIAYAIITNPALPLLEKDKLLLELKENCTAKSFFAPAWEKVGYMLNYETASDLVSKPWLSGFIEGEASFYLVSENSNRIVHGFGIYHKSDRIVLEAIKMLLHIPTVIRYKEKYNYYVLDTTNSKTVENLICYFKDNFIGIQNIQYSIWARSYVKNKGNYAKLFSIIKGTRNVKEYLVHIFEKRSNYSFKLLDSRGLMDKLKTFFANNNLLLNYSTLNILTILDIFINSKHYHTKIYTFSGNNGLLTYWIIPTSSNIIKLFFSWVNRIILHKVFRELCKKYSGFFNYLLNKYKFFSYISFVYSIYLNIDKIILTYGGLWIFIGLGVFTEDPFSYYEILWLYYSVSMLKSYLKYTNNILCNNLTIKTFLIGFLDCLQRILLGIIIGIITNTLISVLKNVVGYILKMNSSENNNTGYNNTGNNDPDRHYNDNNNPNNGKGPTINSTILKRKKSDSDDEEREETHTYIFEKEITPLSPYGGGVESCFDEKHRKIYSVYFKNILVDGKIKKQIEKTEYFDKKGVLYQAVLLKDGNEVAVYNHKKNSIYR